MSNPNLSLLKIKSAIVGAGFGAGLGMIWVAIVATRTVLMERVTDEALLVVLGGSVGLAFGWLMGPARPSRAIRLAITQDLIPAHDPLPALASLSTSPRSLPVPAVPAWAPA